MKRLPVLALLATLAVAGTACDLSSPAATAGSATISRGQLDSELILVANNQYVQCTLQLQGVTLPSPITGEGDDTVNSSVSSFELSTLVLEQLVSQDLAARHVSVTASDLSAARSDFVTEVTPSQSASPCPDGVQGQQLVSRLPGAFVDEQVKFLAEQELLAATLGHVDLSTQALQGYYNAHPSQFQEVCLSDIAVQSQAQAQSIRANIEAGKQTFAAAAQQSSIDTSTSAGGGAIACVPMSEVVNNVVLDAINGLQPGQISQPAFEAQSMGSTTGVWFLLEVNGRPLVPFSQAEPAIRNQLLATQNSTVSDEFAKLTKQAGVTVDPRYGTWSAAGGVQPPKSPPQDIVLSPSADSNGTSSASGAG